MVTVLPIGSYDMEAVAGLLGLFSQFGLGGLFVALVGAFIFAPICGLGLLGWAVWGAVNRLLLSHREDMQKLIGEHRNEREAESAQWRNVVEGQTAAIEQLAGAIQYLRGDAIPFTPRTKRKGMTIGVRT